jgi:lipid-binding SYLF domain-containing protein
MQGTARKLAILAVIVATQGIVPAAVVAATPDPTQALHAAATVLSQIMAAPDRRIADELLERAHCLVVIPQLEVGRFVVTGMRALGFVTCRRQSPTGWSAPAALRLEAGRVGFQVGGATTDLILLVMNHGVVDALVDSKFSLGTEGSVAAGPIGKDLRLTAWQTDADILVWGRSEGRLSGVALEGAIFRQDVEANERIYGTRLSNRDIIVGRGVEPSEDAGPLLTLLSRYAAKMRAEHLPSLPRRVPYGTAPAARPR